MRAYLRAILVAGTALGVAGAAMAQSSSPFSGLFGGSSESEGPVALDVQVAGGDEGLTRQIRQSLLLTGLTRFSEIHSARGRFSGPGFDWEGDFLALGIGNGRQAGGGQLLCPQATINDGLLDLCIVPAPADTVGTLGTLLSGGLLGVDAVSVSARVPWLNVEAPKAIDINLDGEPFSGSTLHFGVRAGALRMHLPADSPLLVRPDAGPA